MRIWAVLLDGDLEGKLTRILGWNELRSMHGGMIQFLVKLGTALGYQSKSEYRILQEGIRTNWTKRIDVVWIKNEEIITFELENGDTDLAICENLKKCLAIKPKKHISIPMTDHECRCLEQLKSLGDFEIVPLFANNNAVNVV